MAVAVYGDVAIGRKMRRVEKFAASETKLDAGTSLTSREATALCH
jgi:hypothetical protein